MKIFNTPEDDILFALIERDNPNLTPKLTPQNCYISSASPNTDDDSAEYNTVAVVVPRYGSGLSRRVTIKYNRINLADLFMGVTPVKVTGNTAVLDYATRAELPGLLGETYGLPIRDGDVDVSSSSAYFYAKPHADYGKGIYRIAENKCFIGQIPIAFSYDFSQSLSTLLKVGAFDALVTPAGIGPVGTNYAWPSTWGFFADLDFTEIQQHINHGNNISWDQAQAIGTFMGKTFINPEGGYVPAAHFDNSDPFAFFSVWATHEARGTVASLRATYPWLDSNFTHVKITKMVRDPSTWQLMDKPRYFAFYFNWYEVAA